MYAADGLFRRILDFGLLACLSLGALYGAARTGLTPRDPSQGVAVIFAPWTAEDRTLTRAASAGSRFVRFGGLPFIAVVMPDDPHYADRVFAGGAWLVIDPKALAGCSAALSYISGQS